MNAPLPPEAAKLREIFEKQGGVINPQPISAPASVSTRATTPSESAPWAPPIATPQPPTAATSMSRPQEAADSNPWMRAARGYVVEGRGIHAFPCNRGSKDPVSRWPWTKRKLTEAELSKYFGNPDDACNIAIALGAPSGNLIDVDLDWPQAHAFGDIFFDDCPAFGRASSPRSHRIAYCHDLAVGRIAFRLPPAAKGHALLPPEHEVCIAEIRSTGHYTVFPYGVHASGEPIEMQQGGKPPTLEAADLKRRTGLLAFCTIAAQMFPSVGLRHDYMMVVSGALAYAGLEAELVRQLIQRIGDVNNDRGTGGSWKVQAEREANRIENDLPTTGIPAFVKMTGLPDECRVRFNKWLGISDERDYGGRAHIQYDEVDLTAMLDATEHALRERRAAIYQRSGKLVHTYRLNQAADNDDVQRPADALGIHEMVAHQLRECIHNHAQFWVPGRDDDGEFTKVDIPTPWPVVHHTAARSERWRLRDLRGVIEVPAMRQDGSIITDDGYDAASGLLLDKGGVEYPHIPLAPTNEQLADAISTLRKPFSLFPFVPDQDGILLGSPEALAAPSASRSVTLSAVLTALCRHLLRHVPLHGTSAPSVGTGKSFIADGIALIATGRTAAVMNYTGDEAEDEKRLIGVLVQGDTILSIDNVEKELCGSFLCQLFTQDSVQCRILGSTGQHRLSTAVTILANGNGLRLAGDMADRAIVGKIDAGVEKPGERKFDGDFRADVLAQRPELVVAGLTLLRGYIVAGRPWPQGTTTSRFTDWDCLVRGCLLWLGEPDPYATKDLVMSTDSARESLDAVIEAIIGTHIGIDKEFSAQDLVVFARADDNLNAALRGVMPMGREPTVKAVSAYLQKHKDRIVGEHVLRGARDSHSARWRFVLQPAPTAVGANQQWDMAI
jgi:hypothetical protein